MSENLSAGNPQVLTIENRNRMNMTGVESVISFSPREITLALSGCKAQVTGENLKIVNFSKSSGAFGAIGTISSVKFLTGALKKGFFK